MSFLTVPSGIKTWHMALETLPGVLQKHTGWLHSLLVLPEGSRAFSPPINPAEMWSGCKAFIILLLASPTATLNWIKEGQKLSNVAKESIFIFFKSNAAKSSISDGMSPQPQACKLSATNHLNVPSWDNKLCPAINKHSSSLPTPQLYVKVEPAGHISNAEKQHRNVYIYRFIHVYLILFVHMGLQKSFFQKGVPAGHRITEWSVVTDTHFKNHVY